MDKLIDAARYDMEAYEPYARKICEERYIRVLEAFRDERVSTSCFAPTTGYGYDDEGRDKLEAIYARVFGCESALCRQQIVSGSHAIALALFGNLLPGDELVTLGMPYDTLQTVIGLNHPTPGSLNELGVNCRVLDIDFDDLDANYIVSQLSPKTKLLEIQRSRGYSLRPSLTVEQIGQVAQAVKKARPDVIVFCDNCYGEFVEKSEPTEVGVDLMAGSLIKNPGAGLAPGGGYVCGKKELVERAAVKLTVPGAGRELGASLTDNRQFYQALLMAPQIVLEAVLGNVFTASLLSRLGFDVKPSADEIKADIIQTICLRTSERLCAYVRGIQRYSPVDSYVTPEPSPMPGYDSKIIMASGGFVAGSSIELSADAPLREPFAVFQQGGLSRYEVIYAVSNTLQDMKKMGLI